MSPRERRRRELEDALASAIRSSQTDENAAFKVDLETGDKVPTIRLAFNRVRERLGANTVNLFSRGNSLYIANRPQTRGRRAATN
jgi:hypothetical protein